MALELVAAIRVLVTTTSPLIVWLLLRAGGDSLVFEREWRRKINDCEITSRERREGVVTE